jgi:hypothetical protein
MFGGTFDPAYLLDITAIEQHCQTATNKRNAALMQAFLSDVLSVPIDRGIVRIRPTPETCLAIGGQTIAADIDHAESESGVKANRRKSTMSTRRKSQIAPIAEKKEEKPSKDRRKSLLFMSWKSQDGGKSLEAAEAVPELPKELPRDLPKEKSHESLKKARMSLVPNVSVESQRQPMSEIPQHGNARSNQHSVKESTNDPSKSSRDRRKSMHPLLPTTQLDTSKSAFNAASSGLDQHPTDRRNSQKQPRDSQFPALRDAEFSAPRSRDPLAQPGPPFLNHSRPASGQRPQSKTTTSTTTAMPELIKLESAIPIALPPPPIPQNITLTPKMSRRKSLIAIFRKDQGVKAAS